MKQDNIDQFLNHLGRLLLSDRDLEVASIAYSKLTLTETEILSIAKLHKIQTILYYNLKKIEHFTNRVIDKKLVNILSETNTKSQEHSKLLHDSILPAVSTCFKNTDIKPIFLKGMSVARYYPLDCPRWMRDVDLFVPDLASSSIISRVFHNDGFQIDIEEIPWIKQHKSERFPRFYGQTVLRKTYKEDYARVDIHYGRYSIGYNGFLDYNFYQSIETREIDQEHLYVLSPEGCLILMFAHMPSMGYIGIKDINDFAAITVQTKLDWNEISDVLNRSHLSSQAVATAQKVVKLYQQSDIVTAAENLLSKLPTRGLNKYWTLNNRSWILRAKINAIYSFEFEKGQDKNFFCKALLTSMQCYSYYIPRFEIKISERNLGDKLFLITQPRYNLLNENFDRRVCIRMIPVPNTSNKIIDYCSSAKLEELISKLNGHFKDVKAHLYDTNLLYIEIGKGQFFVTEASLFICTLDFIVEPQIQILSVDLAKILCSFVADDE